MTILQTSEQKLLAYKRHRAVALEFVKGLFSTLNRVESLRPEMVQLEQDKNPGLFFGLEGFQVQVATTITVFNGQRLGAVQTFFAPGPGEVKRKLHTFFFNELGAAFDDPKLTEVWSQLVRDPLMHGLWLGKVHAALHAAVNTELGISDDPVVA